MESMSAAEARRVALAAQGFAGPRPGGRIDARHLRRFVATVGVLQLDSVNVVARSHELPLHSRCGPHGLGLVHHVAYRRGELFEYWGHEASLLPLDCHALLRWRMERARRGQTWGGLAALASERAAYVDEVLAQVRDAGPITASRLAEPGERRGPWWGWNDGKRALEWLFWTGQVAATRTPTFERLYDLPERALPAAVLAAPTPTEHDAQRELLRRAARAMGVATLADLADYWRLKVPVARPRVDELVEQGELEPVAVEGWRQHAYAVRDLRVPRRAGRTTLLSPFDSLIWHRDRTERLFGFRYRLEIFTPAPQRAYGYYVLPFLWGDRIAARVDTRAERSTSTLWAQAAYAEPSHDAAALAHALAGALRELASHLGLAQVAAGERGDLSGHLRAALNAG